ncbi:hypothetical protein CLAFUW4_06483 [Fulvia fulva]|uniref:Uncharacterized protein n=1 Tax=Passalora fulva TaxID=5499 RepID=A0A9Q8PAS0_PASFU|nr:uncharacterized protein CLAFUR5_06628 [Fulvia fulva]KAK4622289.1 hypothetical protein CLAFUR4_06487 [Fulvia fulva]KAK4623507.1 hypothetical protein CLAFUR0_06488 [Fulvia fulva]UJO19053.1 hypothetical protein CLAFUR5_06628 [Fulvia fulva]WPV15944.1 hypothetical protein CLAFUW4_06483 [Fulvia fulva]WPV30686.1 hypothetical protein CLAFUW7_06483 [Fulvia fulva]
MFSATIIPAAAALLLATCGSVAGQTTTTATSATARLCGQAAFLEQSIDGNQYCCPGSLDKDKDSGADYCCVGNNNGLATNTATSYEAVRTGTIASCSTTIHVTEADYTSKVEAAGTKYGVSYVSKTVNAATRTSYIAVTPTSTGAAAAAKTPALMAGEALLVLGAVALGM